MGLEAKVIAWRPGGYTTALRLWALWGVLLLICCTIPSHPAATQEASYVVMGARGAVARIVFQGDAPCPQIALDGVQQAMDVRPRPSSGFVVTVCEKLIPPGTKSASILGTPLPIPKNSLTSIVVFGDTGCRRKFQPDCSANEWPFKGLSDNAAASHPDLVIHVGDYLYRGNDTWEN
jgi:hypothetical protein